MQAFEDEDEQLFKFETYVKTYIYDELPNTEFYVRLRRGLRPKPVSITVLSNGLDREINDPREMLRIAHANWADL